MLVVLPLLGFFLGVRYGAEKERILTPFRCAAIAPPSYADQSQWSEFDIDRAHFSIKSPIDLPLEEFGWMDTSEWRRDSNGVSGVKLLSITVPKLFEPMSNFLDATLTVGESDDPTAVTQCLEYQLPDQYRSSISNETINGVPYRISKDSGAAAGNRYDTTTYATVHNGQCVVLEYVIHSTYLENYPASFGLHEFDENRVRGLLDRIVRTASFSAR